MTSIDNQCVGQPTSCSESDEPITAHDEVDGDADAPDGDVDSPTHVQCESIIATCTCSCCTNVEVAYQPTDLSQSRSQGSSSARYIQTSWYSKHKWISVCISAYKIFCQVCRSANRQGLLTSQSPFVRDGFSNWKKALNRFKDHERSATHREAVSKLQARSQAVNLGAMISKQYEADKRNNRAMLMKLLRCIHYLARQGLAFRGHHEDSVAFEGNFYQLLLLQATDSPQFSTWIKRRDYISPTIVNKIITLCGNTVLRQLLKDIRAAKYFSVIADEATDISHNEQICIAIRWVDRSYEVHEAAIGLVQLPDTKALTLFSVIKDCFLRCTLPITSCIGQAYDGASNMSGVRNGVQALMKQECDSCLYVHCFAHSLNLCIQDVVKKCELLSNCIEFIMQLVQLIRFSPKRLSLFQSIQQQCSFGDDSSSVPSSLRPLCPTRWTVRHSAIEGVLKNYRALMSCLQCVEEGRDEYAAKARGLLSQMESFELYFSLKLSYTVFAAAEQLSINLQAKDTTVGEGLLGARLLRSHLSTLRSDDKFTVFYDDILKSSQGLTDEPILPRYRKLPRRLDDGSQPHRFTSPKDRYRHAYFEALEQTCGEIERRFDQSDLSVVLKMESLLLNSANGQHTLEPELHQILEKHGVDIDRLKMQIAMLSDTIKTAFDGTVKTVTNVRTIADALNQSSVVRGMLSEVDKLVQAYFTFPVTSATAERSFSSLRRIKTFLRSSMTAQRLNNLFLLYVQKSITDLLDLEAVARDFASVNIRRINYFGHF